MSADGAAATAATDILLESMVPSDPLDLRSSLPAIVHWADSDPVRLRVMRAIDFPIDDISVFVVLNQLVYRGALRPSELAATLGMTRTNVSKIARRLETEGLVRRIRDTGDGRGVVVALTGSGRELGDRILREATRSLDAALAGWPPEDVATLARLLAAFAQHSTRGLATIRARGASEHGSEREHSGRALRS